MAAHDPSRLILRPIRHLADGSYLAKISKSPSDRENDRDGIVVRVIRVTLDDPQRVGRGEEHGLIRIPESLCPLPYILSIADTLDLISVEAHGA